MLSIINYVDIKKYKKFFTTDLNMGSKLYFDKDLIHKIFYEKPEGFEEIIILLDRLNLEELVEIKKLIYKDDKLVGYSMKNYKDYKSLNKFKNRDFKLKKQDSLLIIDSFNKLLINNLGYNDFHLGNILLDKKTNNIKICDLDSLELIEREDYKKYLRYVYILILSYLYNVPFHHIRNVLDTRESNTYLESLNIKDENINIEKIYNIIDKIECEEVKNDKKLVIKKSNSIIDLGYEKFL